MRVTGVRRSGQPVEGVDLVVTTAERNRALAGADVVVIVTPLTEETRGLIGAIEVAALAPGALLVDVSRGGVTNIDAVVSALEFGQLGGACIDVFETEPLAEDSALWDVPNLTVSPHTAGLSGDYLDRLIDVLIASVDALNRGEAPTNVVDHQAGY
jgi:D-2-hydroxyacid dehydrogenase (NADP+)